MISGKWYLPRTEAHKGLELQANKEMLALFSYFTFLIF